MLNTGNGSARQTEKSCRGLSLSHSTRIIVGLSGGVDSSLTAWLLQQQGYDVHGLFMKNWEEDDTSEYCAASQDLADVEKICEQLNIPLHTANFAKEYWQDVFTLFLHEYAEGHTPNPDILCNQFIKFDAFLKYAQTLGAKQIATGHYARITHGPQHLLKKGLDPNKDQSYFLYRLNQHQLAMSLFPIGDLLKTDVRRMAKKAGLHTFQKKDSTGICFIGERKFKTFLQSYLPALPGEIKTLDQQVIGQHDGVMYYTIGQRQGLGIGGTRASTGQPWYVASKDVKNNVLYVVQGKQHPALYRSEAQFTDVQWSTGHAPSFPFECSAKIRYRQVEQACQITQKDANTYQARFLHPQWAVTPGQAIVLYQGEICLGGGTLRNG